MRAIGSCVLLLSLFGCVPQNEDSVVLYSAADREYATPLLDSFTRRQGPEIARVFDVESTKTVGLVQRIQSESARPRCDVFWNNEIMHTIRLERSGLLQTIKWDIPSDWPAEMKSASGRWVGIAARARILIVNRDLLPESGERPTGVADLVDPKWKGKCGIASPLFGTTATHFAILQQTLGERNAAKFFRAIKENAVVLAGNKQVAQAVSSGRLAFGLTDTDDALIEIDSGLPVDLLFPDQLPGQHGTLRIPNTVAVIKGGPNPIAAAVLANFLVSEKTEGRLAMGSSGQFPVRPGHPQKSRAQNESVRWMVADFEAAANRWSDLADQLRSVFSK